MSPASRRFSLRQALPPELRRWWRGRPRLLLEDTPAVQLASLLPLHRNDRLLVLGPDAPLLAALLGDAAELEDAPLVMLGRRPALSASSAAELEVRPLRGRADRLPLADRSVSVVVAPHLLRSWDDARLGRILLEVWRVLGHNGIFVLWEIAPSRSPHVNAVWRRWLRSSLQGGAGEEPRLRSFAEIGRAAYDAGFSWVQTLPLRPFVWPPGPRTSVLMRKEHYTPDVMAGAQSQSRSQSRAP